jgi:hypothetical protein
LSFKESVKPIQMLRMSKARQLVLFVAVALD